MSTSEYLTRLPALLIFLGLGLLLLVALLGFVPFILRLALPLGLLMIAVGVLRLTFSGRRAR